MDIETYSLICVHGSPDERVVLLVHDHGPRQDRDVLEHLLADFGQGGNTHEITFSVKKKNSKTLNENSTFQSFWLRMMRDASVNQLK